MTRHLNLTVLIVVLVVVGSRWSPVWADGGLLWYQPVTQAGDLAQTRQQAVLALHGDKLTYVIQSVYAGSARDVVWVLPLPATPTDVVAHADDRLFKALNAYTRPTFEFPWPSGGGCVCIPNGVVPTGPVGLVQVEASGQAGIYDWAALTSSGSSALMDWLTSNGYAVPASASEVFDTYIQQDVHFLAVRLHETATTQQPTDPVRNGSSATALTQTPPIQFTVQTSRRVYPMVISRISAAAQSEVILYVLGPHRAEAANVPMGSIDSAEVTVNYGNASFTNYEELFTQKIADLGGLALITEFAQPGYLTWQIPQSPPGDIRFYMTLDEWPQIPADLADQVVFLTRLRGLVSRDDMTQDFEFQDAAQDTEVNGHFIVDPYGHTASASMFGQPLAGLVLFGLFRTVMRRRCADRVPRLTQSDFAYRTLVRPALPR